MRGAGGGNREQAHSYIRNSGDFALSAGRILFHAGGMVSPLEQALLFVMVCVIMCGLGATLTWGDFKQAMRSPRPLIVGLTVQWALMPTVAVGLAYAANLTPAQALGLVIVACCPSGATSNLFNYFARGDVALSISLSTVTTALSLVSMPILLAVFGAPFSSEALRIPHGDLFAALTVFLVPVGIGMAIRAKNERWGRNTEETGSFVGILVILFLLVTWVSRNYALLGGTSWRIYVGAVGMGITGFAVGYWFSRVLRLDPRKCRTVALEGGIQNGPLALAIITLSFAEPARSEVMWLPVFYIVFIVLTSTLTTLYFRKISRREWAHFENETIQARLFAGASR